MACVRNARFCTLRLLVHGLAIRHRTAEVIFVKSDVDVSIIKLLLHSRNLLLGSIRVKVISVFLLLKQRLLGSPKNCRFFALTARTRAWTRI